MSRVFKYLIIFRRDIDIVESRVNALIAEKPRNLNVEGEGTVEVCWQPQGGIHYDGDQKSSGYLQAMVLMEIKR